MKFLGLALLVLCMVLEAQSVPTTTTTTVKPTTTTTAITTPTTTTTTTAPKKPCCLPTQFETYRGRRMSESIGPFSWGGKSVAYISADFTNHRFAASENIFVRDKQYNVTILTFPANKTMFVTDGKKCKRITLKKSVENRCIPENATYGGTIDIGVGSHVFEVDSWFMEFKGQGHSPIDYWLTVTPSECMMVIDVAVGKVGFKNALTHDLYFDANLGIQDPKVFDVPNICQQDENGVDEGGDDDILRELVPKMSVFESYLFKDVVEDVGEYFLNFDGRHHDNGIKPLVDIL